MASRRSVAECAWPSVTGSRKRTSAATVQPAAGIATPCDPEPVVRAAHRGGIGGRVDDAERRRRGVLGSAGRVRVEGVALVQQGAEQLLEPVGHHASPRSSSSSRDARVERRRAALQLPAPQPRDGVGMQPRPGAVGVVPLHHLPPGLHRQLPLRGARPGDEHHLHLPVVAAVQDRAGEVEAERHRAVGQAVEVLRRRELEVVEHGTSIENSCCP